MMRGCETSERAADKRQADENAVKFGRTGAEKWIEAALNAKANRTLDDTKRDPTPKQ